MDTYTTLIETVPTRIADLLCSAFEGGSNYWYTNADWKIDGKPLDDSAVPTLRQTALGTDEYYHPTQWVPLAEGGEVTIEISCQDGDGVTVRPINRETLKAGLALMAKKHTRHFADFISENDDALTGDVFLQCVVLGDVVYG